MNRVPCKNGTPVIVLGAGGHSMVCCDIFDQFGYSVSLGPLPVIWDFVADTRKLSDDDWDTLCANCQKFILAVGQIHTPALRRTIVHQVTTRGGDIIPLISPRSYVSKSAMLGKGAFVGHHAVVNPMAHVGDYPILNTGCVIEHAAHIGDFCHISTGAVINGDVCIEENVFVGSNAVVLESLHICGGVLIGAGSVVIENITERGIYVGNPAKRVKDLP